MNYTIILKIGTQRKYFFFRIKRWLKYAQAVDKKFTSFAKPIEQGNTGKNNSGNAFICQKLVWYF